MDNMLTHLYSLGSFGDFFTVGKSPEADEFSLPEVFPVVRFAGFGFVMVEVPVIIASKRGLLLFGTQLVLIEFNNLKPNLLYIDLNIK